MIEIEHLTKRYGAVEAVCDASFRCLPGTVTGFVGPNGAGKSTTLRMICGLAEPSAGRVAVLGTAYRTIPNPDRQSSLAASASSPPSCSPAPR